jgi:hypothetical protein
MKVHFLAPHPLFGRKSAPRPIEDQQQSPYYWWWAYLRRNSEYLKCCENGGKGKFAKLYKEFGDVREDNFKKWWTEEQRGASLFAEQVWLMTLTELEDKSQWDDTWTKESVLIIAAPLTSSKRYLQSRFARLLKERHTAKRGRTAKKLEASNSKYPLERNYTIENLRKTLQVYDEYVRTRGEARKVPLWKVGENLRLVPTAMTSSKLPSEENYLRRNVMGATVKRYLKSAERIISFAAQGRFPIATNAIKVK